MSVLPDHRHPAVIVVLLNWIADTLPAPPPPRSSNETNSGFGRTTWLTCPKCLGERVIHWKKILVDCDHPNCHSQGGWWIDNHDESEQPIAEHINDELRAETLIRCDRCDTKGVYIGQRCWVCQGEGYRRPNWVWRTDLDDDLTIIASPSTHPALDAIETTVTTMRHDPITTHLVGPMLIAYVHQLTPIHQMILPMRHMALRGLLLLSTSLPHNPEFRAPRLARQRAQDHLDQEAELRRRANGNGRHADVQAQDQRDADIIRMRYQQKLSIRQIAARTGIGKSRVKNIVARYQDAA